MSTQEKVLYPFKVVANWKGEVHTLYTHAVSENQAKRNAMQKLANKLRMSVGFVAKAVNAVEVQQVAAK